MEMETPPTELPHNNSNNASRSVSDEEASRSSDYLYNFKELQDKVSCLYTDVQNLVSKQEFKDYVKQNLDNSQDVDVDRLAKRKDDIKETDCPILVVGETSSGKSTIINLLIGKDILPTDITASTTKLCRIRNSDTRAISTRNNKEEVLESRFPNDDDGMANLLEDWAQTQVHNVTYLDIELPVSMIEGNVIIVDSPGIGDKDQEEVASIMMDYLHNALAVVFVVNVANAGGFQTDRLARIISRIRDSMNERMFCFSPEDSIFLLNKWDTIDDDRKKEKFYELTKTKLHTVWKEIDDRHILKLSATKANKTEEYRVLFANFERMLNNVIAKNKNKRIKVHVNFLKSLLGKCQDVTTSQLRKGEEEQDEITQDFIRRDKDFKELSRLVDETEKNLPCLIEEFLDVASRRLHDYLRTDDFKSMIYKDTETFTRFGIKEEIESRIDKAVIDWQKQHIENIFMETVMKEIKEKISDTESSLHLLKEKLQNLAVGTAFKNAVSVITSSGVVGVLLRGFVVNPPVAAGMTVVGLIGGLVWKGAFSDFSDARGKAFKDKIAAFPTDEIKKVFRIKYTNVIKNSVKVSIRDLRKDIGELKKSTDAKKDELFSSTTKTSSLRSLDSTICKLRRDLN